MPLRDPHFQRRIRYVRVDLRRGDAAVAEEALDVADVHALLEEVGGHGVAEHVGGDAVADGAALAVEADQAADHLGGGGFAVQWLAHASSFQGDGQEVSTASAPARSAATGRREPPRQRIPIVGSSHPSRTLHDTPTSNARCFAQRRPLTGARCGSLSGLPVCPQVRAGRKMGQRVVLGGRRMGIYWSEER